MMRGRENHGKRQDGGQNNRIRATITASKPKRFRCFFCPETEVGQKKCVGGAASFCNQHIKRHGTYEVRKCGKSF